MCIIWQYRDIQGDYILTHSVISKPVGQQNPPSSWQMPEMLHVLMRTFLTLPWMGQFKHAVPLQKRSQLETWNPSRIVFQNLIFHMSIVHEYFFQCVTPMRHYDPRSNKTECLTQYQGLGNMVGGHLTHKLPLW